MRYLIENIRCEYYRKHDFCGEPVAGFHFLWGDRDTDVTGFCAKHDPDKVKWR